jgi:hypothetical protein
MECNEIQKSLPAYLEGMVSPEDQEFMEQHLASCSLCSKALADLHRMGELVKDLGEVEPPPWLKPRIMARVREEAEQKKGIIQKLFYPLHIKVPLEAFATVLVAVIAVYVFKAVEPQMERAQLPAPPAPTIAREEAPKQPLEPKADPHRSLGDKVIPPKDREGDKKPVASAPSESRVEPTRKDQIPAPAVVAQEPRGVKKEETLLERSAEGMKIAGALKKEDTADSRAALQAAPQDARERKKLASAPKARGIAVTKTGPIHITIRVKNMEAAGGEVEKLLSGFGALNMEKKSLEGKEVLTAEIQAQIAEKFLEEVNKIGEIKGKPLPPDVQEGDIAIRIEITSAP